MNEEIKAQLRSNPIVVKLMAEIRKDMEDQLSTGYDILSKAGDVPTIIAWVESERMALTNGAAKAIVAGNKHSGISTPLVMMAQTLLSNMYLAILEASRERDRRLDDYPLYRNSVLTAYNRICAEDLRKWEKML